MASPVRILVTGGAGQVGRELLRHPWPADVTVLAPGRETLDLTDGASVARWLDANPVDAVINSAAYTAVDRAETEVGEAFAANAQGPAILADLTRRASIPLLQVSTDYVFDGKSESGYREGDPVAPLGVYGASKLAGELAVRTGNPRAIVLRTAWVLSPHRNNFLKTMLRLAGDREEISVVSDQHGCPTSARDIADALATVSLRMIADRSAPTGVYHFVNAGETSWAGLASTIFDLSRSLQGPSARVKAIASSEYPTPARRPANSRLACGKIEADYGITPKPWPSAVEGIVNELLLKGFAR